MVAMARNNLAGIFYELGRSGEAEAEFRAALELRSKTLGEEHPHTASSSANFADVLLMSGRAHEALPLPESAWVVLGTDRVPPQMRAQAAFPLARVLRANGSAEQRTRADKLARLALPHYREAQYADPAQLEDIERFSSESP